MPKVKGETKYVKRYNEQLIQKALVDVQNGMPKKQAAGLYGIPRQTIQYRLGDKFKKIRHGPMTYLTEDEEDTLEKWIIDSYRKGFPRRKNDIQASVKNFLDMNPRQTPFKQNTPGRHWYKAFLARHPNLVNRTPEAVTKASSAVSENDIRNWFTNIENYLKEKNYFDILNDPTRVYNGDETCFLLCPKEDKVVAPRGSKNVYQVDQGLAKANLTVMFTFAASGAVTPPMIIYPYKRLPTNIVNSVPGEWGIGISDNGWMKSELFFDYISNILHPHLVEQNIQFPIILFVDGHKTHMTYDLSVLCTRLQIILVALYPNATRLIQPADVACFKPLKSAWKLAVLQWKRSNPFIQLNKVHFASILKEALKYLKIPTICNGFRACGLYPWNVEMINFSKCLGKNYNKATPSANKKIDYHPSITYDDFVKIIGAEKLNEIKLKITSKNDDLNEDFKLLVKIFDKLSNYKEDDETEEIDESVVRIDDIDLTETEVTYEQHYFTEEEINAMPIVFPNNSVIQSHEVFDKPVSADISQSTTLSGSSNSAIYVIPEPPHNHMENQSTDISCDLNSFPCKNANNLLLPSTSSSNDLTVQNMQDTPECHELETIQSSPTNNIDKYLLWQNTPERKGKTQTARIPFVITSSGWKKIQEDKQKEIEEKERIKNEKKRTRELNALTKTLKATAVKKARKENISLTVTATGAKRLSTDVTKEILGINNRKKKPSHIRNLTSTMNIEDTDETEKLKNILVEHTSKILNEEENNSPPENNKIIYKGLCFICTNNISIVNFAIQCENCTRLYHYRCLKKNNLYVEHFLCKVCNKKKIIANK